MNYGLIDIEQSLFKEYRHLVVIACFEENGILLEILFKGQIEELLVDKGIQKMLSEPLV